MLGERRDGQAPWGGWGGVTASAAPMSTSAWEARGRWEPAPTTQVAPEEQSHGPGTCRELQGRAGVEGVWGRNRAWRISSLWQGHRTSELSLRYGGSSSGQIFQRKHKTTSQVWISDGHDVSKHHTMPRTCLYQHVFVAYLKFTFNWASCVFRLLNLAALPLVSHLFYKWEMQALEE